MMGEERMAPAPGGGALRRGEGDGRLRLTRAEWLVLLVLGAVQFTHIVDFTMVMPLGPWFMSPAGLGIDPTQFGLVVAAYGFSAGLASLFAAWFIDRFDRKTALLALFAGLAASTLLCAAATSYPLLVLARVLAGAFGGVTAACVLTIVGDVFPDARRGTANGIVMSAFSVASVVGVPAGLGLAEHFHNWRVPFGVLGALGGAVLVLVYWVLPPLRGHLAAGRGGRRVNTWEVLSEPSHLRAYSLMTALVLSSFLIVPYLTTYLVQNVGRRETELKYIYLFGGLATLVSTPLVGWLSDRVGKLPVFRVFALLTVFPLLAVSNLPPVPLAVVLGVTTFMFIVTSARWVPAMALITASAVPRLRGSFLSVNASVQQVALGLASLAGGALLGKAADGSMTGFGTAGALASAAAVLSVVLGGRLRPARGGADAVDVLDAAAEAEPEEAPMPPVRPRPVQAPGLGAISIPPRRC